MTIFSFDCGTSELFLFSPFMLCGKADLKKTYYKTVLWVFHVLLENESCDAGVRQNWRPDHNSGPL